MEAPLDDMIQEFTEEQYYKLSEFLIKVRHIQTLPSFDNAVLQDAQYHYFTNTLCEGEESPLKWDVSVIKSKGFTKSIGNLTPQTLKENMWKNVKHDDPDTLIARHLRARNWDVDTSLLMMLNSVRWRTEYNMIDGLLAGGDEKIKYEAENGTGEDQKVASEVMAQLRSGKSFTNGTDKKGRPLLFTRVQKHNPNAQSLKGLEQYTVFQSESARMLFRPPITQAAIIFDLGGFSMANMDWNAIRLLTAGLEDKYPESTGVTYVYRPSWIINGIWSVVKKWMPGTEAQKVMFIKDASELSQYVDLKFLPADMGGTGDFDFKYTEPVVGENSTMKDTTKRDEIARERQNLVDRYEKLTLEWVELLQLEKAKSGIESGGYMDDEAIAKAMEKTEQKTSAQALVERRKLMSKLKANYFELDPYVRGRVHGDRVNLPPVGATVQVES